MVARARDVRKQGIAEDVRLMPLRLNQTDTPVTADGFAVINDRVGLGEAREPYPGHGRLIRRMTVKHIRTQQGETLCSVKWLLFSLRRPRLARLRFRPLPRRPGATATGAGTTGAGAALGWELASGSSAARSWRTLASSVRLSAPPMARWFVG